MKSKVWLSATSSTKQWTSSSGALLRSHSNNLIHRHCHPLYKQPSLRSFSVTPFSKTAAASTALITEEHHLKPLPLFDFFGSAPLTKTPQYEFAHGASGFAKRYTTPLQKSQDHYYSVQNGEDAYFRRSDAIGVADGVGGWTGVSSKIDYIINI
jgi:hypothetical protein